MNTLLRFLGKTLSPTRALIDWKKKGTMGAVRADLLLRWNRLLFWTEVALAILQCFPSPFGSGLVPRICSWIVLLYAFSRCNEIAWAFYNDAFSRLDGKKSRSTLTVGDRIIMAIRSYAGLVINFSLIYYLFPVEKAFSGNEKILDYFDAMYFSGVTISTLGYGDIYPVHWLARCFSLYEVFLGIFIIVVALAIYIGGIGDGLKNRSENS